MAFTLLGSTLCPVVIDAPFECGSEIQAGRLVNTELFWVKNVVFTPYPSGAPETSSSKSEGSKEDNLANSLQLDSEFLS